MEPIQYDIRALSNGVYSLDFRGEIDVYNSQGLKEALARQLEDGHDRVIVNLEQVRYIDSTGLGALLEGFERFKRRQGSVAVVCTHPRMRRIFKITGLQNMMQVMQNEVEALLSLAPTGPPVQSARP